MHTTQSDQITSTLFSAGHVSFKQNHLMPRCQFSHKDTHLTFDSKIDTVEISHRVSSDICNAANQDKSDKKERGKERGKRKKCSYCSAYCTVQYVT